MNISKSLVMSLVLAVVVLSSLLVYQSFGQKSVLGENTTDKTIIIPQEGICSDLVRMTNQYCSQNKPKVTPPSYPMEVTIIPGKPTLAKVCRTGLSNFSVGSPCKAVSQSIYLLAKYTCYDGYSGEVRSEKGECITSTQLQIMAIKACTGRSNCKPVPSPYK